MAVGGSFWEGLRDLSPSTRCDRQRILETADDAMVALHSLRVDDGFVSSWSAHSRRAIAREPASPFGFLDVASTMIVRTARKICRVTAPHVSRISYTPRRTIQRISTALPRLVNLSNWAASEIDVSLWSDCGRKTFPKIPGLPVRDGDDQSQGETPDRIEADDPTDDLRSFWTTTYHQVRKDLRGRYPKHAWPEDPCTAQPSKKGKSR